MSCGCNKTVYGKTSVNTRCNNKGVYTGLTEGIYVPESCKCTEAEGKDRIYIKSNELDPCCVANVLQVGKTSDWKEYETEIVPLKGQIIVYTDDETNEFVGFKIGNGCADLANLEFADLGGVCDCEAIIERLEKIEQEMENIDTVDQVFDEKSTHAQSGIAIYEYIKNLKLTVEQAWDATSVNAMSGVAVQEGIEKNISQTYNEASKLAMSGTAVKQAIEKSVDTTYNEKSLKAQSGTAVAEAIEKSVDQTYDETSTRAQSGTAVKEAIENSVDQKYNDASQKAQSGTAVKEAIDLAIEDIYDETSEKAMSGKAVKEAIDIERSCLHSTLTVAGWSATTTTVNGTDYYTQAVTPTKIYWDHPEIYIDGDILPTKAEQEAYDCIDYAYSDGTTVTFYASELPTLDVKVVIKGVK